MARNLVIDRRSTTNRLAAARGLLAEYSHAGRQAQPPDWSTWAARLAGALSSVVSVAEEAVDLNAEMADICEAILR